MNIQFFNTDGTDHVNMSTLSGSQKIWVNRACGEGGEFDTRVIDNIIYEAITRFFKDNF